MISGIVTDMFLECETWRGSPFTRSSIARSCGSGISSGVTIHGPSQTMAAIMPPEDGPPNNVAKCIDASHLATVNTVEEIKKAIGKLSLEERAEIAAELCGWTDDDWDRQMKSDAAAGKFGKLNDGADAAHAAGQTLPFDDILREP